MRSAFFFVIMIGCMLSGVAQKRILDTSLQTTFDRWPEVNQAQLSRDGKYVVYVMENMPIAGEQTLLVCSTSGGWQRSWVRGTNGNFTADSRELLLQLPGDSMCIVSLGGEEERVMSHVGGYTLMHGIEGQEWLAYHRTDTLGLLVLQERVTGWEERIQGVEDYRFNRQGTVLLLERMKHADSVKGERQLEWKELKAGGQTRVIWKGALATQYIFDKRGERLAFEAVSLNKIPESRVLWYYRSGEPHAEIAAEEGNPGVDSNWEITREEPVFSVDGSRIFFRLRRKAVMQALNEGARVDVWHYRDIVLRSDQAQEEGIPKECLAMVRVGDRRVICLQQEEETLEADLSSGSEQAVAYTERSGLEAWWNVRAVYPSPLYCVSLRDGSRRIIKSRGSYKLAPFQITFSPEGRWILYFDRTTRRWESYEVSSGQAYSIGKDIPYAVYSLNDSNFANAPFNRKLTAVGVAGWREEDHRVLLYDDYDLWEVDPMGIQKSVNLTQGYGRKHGVKLRLTAIGGRDWTRMLRQGDTLLLAGFEPETKRNGFYRMVIGSGTFPELLSRGDYVMYCSPSQLMRSARSNEELLLQAQDARLWLVSRRSATEARNFYTTRDFKTFAQVSDLEPQRGYNWLKTNLVHWPMEDGRKGSGILYQPEDLDTSKKYPLIFYYYEQYSDNLNDFPRPSLSDGSINIPYFVSRGYLVFVPDICYRIGSPGASAVAAVVSAAQYLSKRYGYVDRKHMGLQGHSFGGYETNYIVTHTQLFAAASEAAGVSDCVSNYNELRYGRWGQGSSMQYHYETDQGRIGGTLWENPSGYITNSPIFRADQVATPLLMMHCVRDGSVAFSQAVELFTALRRLGKRVWLLQYDEGDHGLFAGRDVLDYTIRLTQFFDHYLKGAGAPVWMTEGIPARDKGRRTGYEIDSSGKEP